MITIWSLVRGILELASAFSTQRSFTHDWTMVIGSIVSVVLNIVLFFYSRSMFSLLWLIGIFAIVFGVLMFTRSVQFKTSAA